VSFFAFQDIITSVIGVVLFIALLLALFITVDRPAHDEDIPARQIASPEDVEHLENLLVEIVELETQLQLAKSAQQFAGPAEIDALREELQQILSQIAAIPSAELRSTAAPEMQAEFTKMENDLNRLLGQVSEARGLLSKWRDEVHKMEEQLEATLQAQLQEEGRKNDIFLIPEKQHSSKSPLLLDVREALISLQTLDGQSFAARSTSSGDLKVLLEDFPRTEFYVVAYFRPSTFHLSEQILSTLRALNYELGYDVLRDDQNITLGSPGSP
jgi:hypothetical protein